MPVDDTIEEMAEEEEGSQDENGSQNGSAGSNEEKKSSDDGSSKPKAFVPRMIHKFRAAILHVGLIITCVLYIVLGALAFLFIERPKEVAMRDAALEKYDLLREDLLRNVNMSRTREEVESLVDTYMEKMLQLFEEPHAAFTFETHFTDYGTPKDLWTFESATLLTATTVIPVGYGYVAPATELGRGLIVGYGIVGIPLALVTIADTGKFISQWITNYFDESMMIPMMLFVVLLFSYPLVGGLVLHYMADMTILDAIYFSLTSIFTIGFGDLAPQVNVVNLVLFIVFGVVLVTITIDFVAAEIIDHIHYVGRHAGRAKELAEKMFKMAQKVNMTSVSAGMAQLHALARFGLLGNVDRKVVETSGATLRVPPTAAETFNPQFDDFEFMDQNSRDIRVSQLDMRGLGSA